MSNHKFDRETYLQIAKTQSISAALTQLQKDTIDWEYQAFEGEKGYDPQAWQVLLGVRKFARELWDMDLHKDDHPKS
jgi:hypothetical protein